MQSGGWAKCASRQPIQERNTPLVIPSAGQAAGFGFANRSTVSGKQCALPYVLKYAPAHCTRDIWQQQSRPSPHLPKNLDTSLEMVLVLWPSLSYTETNS